MPEFERMTINELVCAQGYDCDCGRRHVCALDYLNISRGAIADVPQLVRALGAKRPFVVADANTWRVAGERVSRLLTEAGIEHQAYVIPCAGERIAPAEWEVGSVVMHLDPKADLILGVGSGVINDICKVVAHASGRKNAIVGTAPSMDGYASNSSSMEVNHVKVSLFNQAPSGILLDTDILCQAPMRMLWAGLGDMVAKYIATCEWRISHLVTGEYYCEHVAALMRAALKRVADAADGIPARDPDAIQSIAEGLVIAGIGMAYAQISRPASGLEHYFSHMWEMMALERGEPYDLHGIQVGVGTELTMKLCGKLKEVKPDRAVAEAYWADMTQEKWEAQIRRIFRKTAPEIIELEGALHKNDPAEHQERLERIITHWEEILAIVREELPDYDALHSLMKKAGLPLRPSEIGVSVDDTVNAFIGSRDIRKKYLTSTLLWDLGLTGEFADYQRQVAES
ncbi:MAG: sn-glycerol-1-phosphate dehydrogenase [Clostridia bacterium]|nr:sn-glycerol-1-phosphate dehydrogenase [Clostridia bacterium]